MSLHAIERLGDQLDRFPVPGGWIYRTWLLSTPQRADISGHVRVQMQAVFVPSEPRVGPAEVQAISAAVTVVRPSSEQPLTAGSTPGPEEWPKTEVAIRVLCDLWIARWGHGSAPGDVIRNQALVLKKAKAPWDAVQRSFRRYVDTVEDQFASPYAWRKRWQSFDPETPEHDHEAAKIVDSYDRQARAMRRGSGGLQAIGETLKRLPEGKR